jgi:hypothetical protein
MRELTPELLRQKWLDVARLKHRRGDTGDLRERQLIARLLGPEDWATFAAESGLPLDPGAALANAPTGGQPTTQIIQRSGPAQAMTPPAPSDGPGRRLAALLASLGFTKVGCAGCNDLSLQMNLWGIEGVQARREEIKVWLKSKYVEQSWGSILAAAGKAVVSGVAFRIDPLDVFGSLIDEACRQYKEVVAGKTPSE